MKFMNMKRFGAVVMAGALAVSMMAPAFAASNNTTTIEGGYEEMPIAVVVPTTGTAQINPYGLPVTLTKTDTTKVQITGQKITTQPLSLRNQGTVGMDVNASLKVLPKGDASIRGAALTASETGKEIDVSLEVAGLDNAKYAVSTIDPTLEDALIDAFADPATWTGAGSLRAPAAASPSATVTPAKSGAALAVLGAATEAGGLVTYGNDSIAMFRLTGELNQEPNDGASPAVDTPWTEEDGFTATIVFKFTPTVPSAGDATVTLSPLTLGADGNVTATFNAGSTSLTVTSWSWNSNNPSVATVTSSGTTGAVDVVSTTSNDTCNISVTATLSNGATLAATAPCVVTVP